MFVVSYIQQYFNTSITVLINQVWKLLIALFKVPNTGAFTVCKGRRVQEKILHYCLTESWWLRLVLLSGYLTFITFHYQIVLNEEDWWFYCNLKKNKTTTQQPWMIP